MKVKKLLTPLMCLIFSGCTSTEMTLKRIDQDIPGAIVKKYNSNTESYVDEGKYFCLPLLLSTDSYVAKTSTGFQGYSNANLGIILVDNTKYSDFDENGKLTKCRCHKTFLTSLVYSRSCRHIFDENEPKHSSSKRIFFNAFGSNSKISGEQQLVVLWLPITTKKAN
jgi:hypothetical protein